MNRIDRLFATLLILQQRSLVRAEDLAQRFEISVRTVYRDVAALSEMGVPIVSLPGEGYQLMDGYFLPPLVFSEGEAGALVLSTNMLMQQAEGAITLDAERALEKLLHVLPRRVREEAEAHAEIIRFYAPTRRFNLDDRRLRVLQQAIRQRRLLWLRYFGFNEQQISERTVEPHQLIYSNGAWYFAAYCRLRQDFRSFRLDRVEEMRLQRDHFDPRAQTEAAQTTIEVRVRFTGDVVRWVRERQLYAFVAEEAVPGSEDRLMIYAVHQLSEMTPWLLSWGAAAEVLSPPELRRQIRSEAKRLWEILT